MVKDVKLSSYTPRRRLGGSGTKSPTHSYSAPDGKERISSGPGRQTVKEKVPGTRLTGSMEGL